MLAYVQGGWYITSSILEMPVCKIPPLLYVIFVPLYLFKAKKMIHRKAPNQFWKMENYPFPPLYYKYNLISGALMLHFVRQRSSLTAWGGGGGITCGSRHIVRVK